LWFALLVCFETILPLTSYVGLEEVSELPLDQLIVRIQEFLDLERDNAVLDKVMNEGMADSADDVNRISKLNEMFAKGALLLSVAQSVHPEKKVLQVLDDVLLDEMRISKNLTAWPCESFWTVGEPKNRLELSPIIKRISQDMSPNCSAPFTSCFVKRDKCEFDGDGKCA
jgi:hypothetical protein